MFTEEEKANQDLDYLIMILKNAHYYKDAPNDSEHQILFNLGADQCNNVLKLILKIKNCHIDFNNVDESPNVKFFIYFTHLMEYGNDMGSFYDGTCEKMAYYIDEDVRSKIVKVINKVKKFNPYE